MPQHFTFAKALRVTRALKIAVERMELNNYAGEEDEHIEDVRVALGQMLAIPAVRAAINKEESYY